MSVHFESIPKRDINLRFKIKLYKFFGSSVIFGYAGIKQ